MLAASLKMLSIENGEYLHFDFIFTQSTPACLSPLQLLQPTQKLLTEPSSLHPGVTTGRGRDWSFSGWQGHTTLAVVSLTHLVRLMFAYCLDAWIFSLQHHSYLGRYLKVSNKFIEIENWCLPTHAKLMKECIVRRHRLKSSANGNGLEMFI